MIVVYCEKCCGNFIHEYSRIRREVVCTRCTAGAAALNAEQYPRPVFCKPTR